MSFSHTPYDGSSAPFAIGLSPLDPDEWIETDASLEAYLAEKDRLRALHPDKVFAQEKDTEDSQQEVLNALATHLPNRYPDIYTAADGVIAIAGAGRKISTAGTGEPRLLTAAKLVQEDLVIMRKGAIGWRLAAASLSFPSSWSLLEKFGRPMHEIHAPVPDFGKGSRNAALIERMFDNLSPERPVKRFNWSLYTDGELYHPAASGERGSAAESAFVRVERQTLRKMPVSGDILFTIRIHLDPLKALQNHPGSSMLARAMAAQLAALSKQQLEYKGLAASRDALLAKLALL